MGAVERDADRVWQRAEECARDAIEGRTEAWREFWTLVEPELKRWLARPGFLGGLSDQDDARDAVCLRCMESLCRDEFRRLRMYVENPRAEKSFRAWLRTVLKHTGIDYIRAHEEYDRRRRSTGAERGRPRGWREKMRLSTSAGMGATRPAFTDETTAKELMAFAMDTVSQRGIEAFALWDAGTGLTEIREALGCKDVDEVRALVAPMQKVAALELWLEGASFADIAADLRLDAPAAAQNLVDAAKEQLRRRFRGA